MSRQIIRVLAIFSVVSCHLISFEAHAQNQSSSGSYIGQTQQRRAAERFNILDFVRSQQAAVSAQNAKYGKGNYSPGPYVDVVLSYAQDSGNVTRDSIELGKDTRGQARLQFLLDDLFTQGNKKRSLNIDLGFEAYYGQTTKFEPAATSTQASHSYTETGAGLLIRPFGRSSQDTGLLVKGGYANITETGLWFNNQNPVSIYGTYLGSEAKLYLLQFLGLKAEYQNFLETESSALSGKWKLQRFTYGAFLEVYLVKLGAYFMSTEMVLTPSATGTAVKEVYSGVGFSGTLYF